jgi:hypothetical protein
MIAARPLVRADEKLIAFVNWNQRYEVSWRQRGLWLRTCPVSEYPLDATGAIQAPFKLRPKSYSAVRRARA